MKNVGATFYRSLVSFLAVLLCLFFGSYALSIAYITEQYSLRYAEGIRSSLEQANAAIGSDIWQMLNLCYLIQKDTDIKYLNEGSSVVERRQASASISRYNAACGFADLICCYCPDSPYIYLPSESITTELFMNQQYAYTDHTTEDLRQALISEQGLQVWSEDIVFTPGKKPKQYVTVFVSMADRPVGMRLRTIYLISAVQLQSYFSALHDTNNVTLCLMDADGQRFYSAGDDDVSAALCEMASDDTAETAKAKLVDKDYYVYKMKTSIGDWTIAAAVDVAMTQGVPINQLYGVTGVLTLLMLVGCVLFFLVARHNYRPIQQLINAAFPQGGVSRKDNEIAAIEREMKRLSAKSDRLHRTLQVQANASRQSLISKLLNGGESEERLRGLASACGVELSGEAFAVLALYIDGYKDSEHTFEQTRECVLRFFSDLPQVLIHHHDSEPNRMTIILTMAYSDSLESIAEPLQEHLEDRLGASVAIGYSAVGVSYAEITTLYQQACQALDMRVVHGRHSVFAYSQQEVMSQAVRLYNPQDMEKLQWYLLQLDEENTALVMDNMIDALREGNVHVSAARMICYDIINTIVRCLNSLWEEEDFVVHAQVLEELVAFDTVEELTHTLKSMITATCTSIRERRQNRQSKRIEVLTDYINAHYRDADMSANSVADHFQISVSNLSHYFKTHMGKTLADYIQNLRFAESCRLLAETDDSVQEICEVIGMLNVSSFIRRFKQIYGVTPGAYRTSHRKKM